MNPLWPQNAESERLRSASAIRAAPCRSAGYGTGSDNVTRTVRGKLPVFFRCSFLATRLRRPSAARIGDLVLVEEHHRRGVFTAADMAAAVADLPIGAAEGGWHSLPRRRSGLA